MVILVKGNPYLLPHGRQWCKLETLSIDPSIGQRYHSNAGQTLWINTKRPMQTTSSFLSHEGAQLYADVHQPQYG